MATKWVREFGFTLDLGLYAFYAAIKVVAMFLRYGGTNFTYQGDDATNAGVGDSISYNPVGNVCTLTDAAGLFSNQVVGYSITIAGATNPGNNGSFTITNYISRTQIQYVNATGVTETSAFTWSIADGRSWFATLKTGTNGELNLTGTDYQFRDTTAASFDGGDVGRYIVIAGNVRNAGVYQVASFIDASNITINFVCNADEFPDQETGLSWRTFDFTAVPLGDGAYVEFTSPGSPSWRVRLTLKSFYDNGQYVRMTIDPDAADSSKQLADVITGITYSTSAYLYLAVDDGGDHLHMMVHQSTNDRHNGFFVSRLDPAEPRPDISKVVCGGNIGITTAQYDNENWQRIYDNYHIGRISYWHDGLESSRNAYLLEPSYANYDFGLSKWASRERNRRASGSSSATGGTGDSISMAGSVATLTDAAGLFTATDVGKRIQIWGCTNPGNTGSFIVTAYLSATQIQFTNASGVNETSSFSWDMSVQDLVSGSVIIDEDVNNYAGEYAILGILQGHYSGRGNLGDRKAVMQAGYKDKFHFQAGWLLDWPNVTPQH